MGSLHSTSFRWTLVVVSVVVTAGSAIRHPTSDIPGFFAVTLLYCPGIYFAAAVLASFRTASLKYHAVRTVLFVIATVAASFGVVQLAMFLTPTAAQATFVIAGMLGALGAAALMRVLLAYKLHGAIAWIAVIVAGGLSQFAAVVLEPTEVAGAELFLPALMWWWFVGEALLWQQRGPANPSNYSLGRPHEAAD